MMYSGLSRKIARQVAASLGVLTCCSQTSYAINETETYINGDLEWDKKNCETNHNFHCKYNVADKHLTISGTGKMSEYFSIRNVEDVVETITIGNGITKISESAFAGCSRLKSVSIPNTVEKVSKYAFAGCTNLKSIYIPKSVREIDDFAFAKTGLTSITIPESVKRVGVCAFAECHNLKKVIMLNDLNGYAGEVFENCSSLCDLRLSAPVDRNIWEVRRAIGCFNGCISLNRNVSNDNIKEDRLLRWLEQL